MNQYPTPNTTSHLSQGSLYPKQLHNPYTKMSQRRAIACTICAKAKTKCDKATPSCSRCTAKGLTCEPRSTRRTSDSGYRSTKKAVVSPKRFLSTNPITMQSISRHSSPRSVPSSNRHQLARAVSQMDFQTAVKLGQHRPDFAAMSMLTPLQNYTPHIVDECYSYSSSSEPSMAPFSPDSFSSDSFSYAEPMPINEHFDQYMDLQRWSHNGQIPVGLGFENDMPGLMPGQPDMRVWAPDFEANYNSAVCESPNTWSHSALSVSPQPPHTRDYNSAVCESPNTWSHSGLSVSPQPPHTRDVPSLPISECSAQESDSPRGSQEEWTSFHSFQQNTMSNTQPITSTPYLDNIKTMPMAVKTWDGNGSVHSRSSTY